MKATDLEMARRCLAAVDAAFLGAESPFRLEEGLSLLESVVEAGDEGSAAVARNLGAACIGRIVERSRTLLSEHDVPEPQLKQLLALVRTADASAFAETAEADVGALVRAVADRYLDAVLEGYPPDERAALIERARKQLLDSGS